MVVELLKKLSRRAVRPWALGMAATALPFAPTTPAIVRLLAVNGTRTETL